MRHALSLCFLGLLCAAGPLGAAEAPVPDHWDGSRTTPVHRLPVLDAGARPIVPSAEDAPPFSVRTTCGPCHPYGTVGGGLHFNATRPGPAGRPGEPWVWTDGPTGTELPLSYRGWKGTWKPEAVGITPWKFTQLFGRHLPGGDAAEPAENADETPDSRWEVSGSAEINCMGCHNASRRQDSSEWALQMERENFRWAATAASGLGEVSGMAVRLKNSWRPLDGRNPDDSEWAPPPAVRYDAAQFDSKNRAFFDVSRQPPDERCLYCHSASPKDMPRWSLDRDVHSARGMACAECHPNGLAHDMVRGYEGEAAETHKPVADDFTCRGCHLGPRDTKTLRPGGGRFAAPRPEHEGMPATHLEKMTCTACHSGPWPETETAAVRLSRANRLGIHGRARWETELPEVAQPVFAKDPAGRIAPHRLMFPAYWARIDGAELHPLSPDEVAKAAGDVLDAEKQVGAVLAALGQNPDTTGTAVLVLGGKTMQCDADGGLHVVEGTTLAAATGGSTSTLASSATLAAGAAAPVWGLRRDDRVLPLLPALPASAEVLDPEAETQLANLLTALATMDLPASGPLLLYPGVQFRLDADGNLEKTPRTGTEAPGPARLLPDGTVRPLLGAETLRAAAATAGTGRTLTPEQMERGLQRLSATGGQFGYVCGGKLYQLKDGRAAAGDHPGAQPYLWPLAHDVRPAAQSLGVKGCEDCHAKDAPFFFGQVRVKTPVAGIEGLVPRMADLQGPEEPQYELTNRFFYWLIGITLTLLALHIAGDLFRKALNRRKA